MKLLFKNITYITDNKTQHGDILVNGDTIVRMDKVIECPSLCREITLPHDCILIPGVIDDQVHFREPGLTHKADIGSESRAAVAGGVTTFMEMPNTNPPTLTQTLLQQKYDIASVSSYTNYSFFMGASNDNYDEVMRTSTRDVCGVKIFMGSSTGNMLVDNTQVLERLFGNVSMLIATHCEDETTIRSRHEQFAAMYGHRLNASHHPLIRNEEACYLSSSSAVEMAKRLGTRLHILHISTSEELALFDNSIPLQAKKITSEVCVHHLMFTADDYEALGTQIKCNPAIKDKRHRPLLWEALLEDRLDIIATDHAPHTWQEKQQPYSQAPSGLPLVQHSLSMMMDAHDQGLISLERMVDKMCHAPAVCFDIKDRGYLREGMKADMVVINPNQAKSIDKQNILYKCGWSPLEGRTLTGRVESTYINGVLAYDRQQNILSQGHGQRVLFDRGK
jgi:dihydroorotase